MVRAAVEVDDLDGQKEWENSIITRSFGGEECEEEESAFPVRPSAFLLTSLDAALSICASPLAVLRAMMSMRGSLNLPSGESEKSSHARRILLPVWCIFHTCFTEDVPRAVLGSIGYRTTLSENSSRRS